MRNPQTLFVVGAGASSEAGLPTGKELIDIIALRLNYRIEHGSLIEGHGDKDILDIFQQRTATGEGINDYFKAAWRVRDGIVYSKSVDSFMDLHREDPQLQLCGKLAIVKSILEAEQLSKLYVERGGTQFRDLEGLKNTWYFDFAKNVTDGVRRTEMGRIFEKVSFIIFNYDRCFEHFMFNALKNLYGIDDSDASAAMKTLNITHPYGTIGNLPWQARDGIPFGFIANRANMEVMASRIKTYTEQIEKSDAFAAMQAAVRNADTLVFLGFSYHPENMKLLKADYPGNMQQIFGTAKGISNSDTKIVFDQVEKILERG
jgi:hypothetical protein